MQGYRKSKRADLHKHSKKAMLFNEQKKQFELKMQRMKEVQKREVNQIRTAMPEAIEKAGTLKMVNDGAADGGQNTVSAAVPSGLMDAGQKFQAEKTAFQEGVLKVNQVLPAESLAANAPEKPAKAKRASKIKENKMQVMKTLR